MNFQQAVPFDASAFLNQAQEGATVDEAAGTVQNLNQANIQSQLTNYQQSLQGYINNQNPDATVGEVLGSKTIQQIQFPYLPASLPYSVKATGNRYSALPNNLRHQFQYALYRTANDIVLENPIWLYQQSTPNLAGKKLTLSFVPATEDDRKAIESYLPKPHADGSPIQPEEFPQSLPAYSIYVKPELRLEGQVVATSSQSFTLGTELIGEGGFTNMNLQGLDLTRDDHIAGQSSALGLSIQGISSQQLTSIKSRLEQTKAKLESNESSQLETLTGEHLSGDLLSATIASYHASLESFGKLAQRQAKIVDNPGLSFGFFHAQAVPRKQYGVVTAVRFPGMLMDVGHIRRLSYSHNNQQADWVNYNRLRGQHSSAMEHAIPEQFFSDPSSATKPEGVSAVKALAVAASQGQRIYTLTQANQSQLNNIQQSAAIKSNIQAALNAGKEVTIHQSPISYAGFSGAGYVITDPQTGAGAYLIEGGARGAVLFFAGVLAGALTVGILVAFTPLILAGPVGIGAALVSALIITGFLIPLIAFIDQVYKSATPKQQGCFATGVLVGVGGAAGAPTAGVPAVVLLGAIFTALGAGGIPSQTSFQDCFFVAAD